MEMFYKPSEAAKFLGTTVRVVKYMKKTGKLIPDIVDATGHFFYSQSQLIRIKNGTTVQNGTNGTTVQMSNIENGAISELENKKTAQNSEQAAQPSKIENTTKQFFSQSLDEQISQVKSIQPQLLLNHGILTEASHGGFVCLCGNGSGDDGTGIDSFLNNHNVWTYHCFKCNSTHTNINYLAHHFNLNPKQDFVEIINKACYMFNISLPQDNLQDSAQKDYSKFYYVTQKNLVGWLKSVGGSWRGLSPDTLQHFNCGFANGRVIIPHNHYHYLARAIDNTADKPKKHHEIGRAHV